MCLCVCVFYCDSTHNKMFGRNNANNIIVFYFFINQHNKAHFINYISVFSTVQLGVASGMSIFELEPCRKKPLAHWLDTHARKLIFHGDITYTWREWGSTTPFIWMADAMLATSFIWMADAMLASSFIWKAYAMLATSFIWMADAMLATSFILMADAMLATPFI